MHRILCAMLLAGAMVIGAGSAVAAETVSGKIAKLDSSARNFSVSYGKKTLALSLASDAEVLDAGKAISLAALKVGDRVTVQYADQGEQHVASRVEKIKATILGSGHPKKMQHY